MIRLRPARLLPFLPFAGGVAVAALALALGSPRPDAALRAFFVTPFTSALYLGDLFDRAALYLVCALGFLVGKRMTVFNLGGEGQAYLGALVALETALVLTTLPPWLGVPLALVAGTLAAAATGALAATLRNRIGLSELISTFLIASALLPFIDYLVAGPLRDQAGMLISTPAVPATWRFAAPLPPSGLNLGILAAAALIPLVHLLLERTRFGFESRLAADNPEFARAQGVALPRIALAGLAIGSGLHGLAGGLAVFGSQHAVFAGSTAGFGWNGIAAALIGRSHPLGAVAGALLFAWLDAGCHAARMHSSISIDLAGLIQGTVFLLVTIPLVAGQARKSGGERP